MTEKRTSTANAADRAAAREKRLAEALRQNLKKRKMQARVRDERARAPGKEDRGT